MSKTVLITGGAGQLGTELVREFRQRDWHVVPLNRSGLNITDLAAVEAKVADASPQLVINSAAYNQVDVAEQEPAAAFQVNALAVRNLAVACRQSGARLIHFSTDYVFDGAAGRPYREDDATHPLSAYAVSKLAGEIYARAYLDDVMIIRTSGVFGPAGRATARGNFVELMLRRAAAGQPIKVVEDHVASPTFAPELARLTADLEERGATGVFHGGGEQAISWFDFASLIFRCAGLQPQLTATNEREYRTAARRPKYSALENAGAARLGVRPFPPLEDCVQAYLAARSAPGGTV